MDGTRVHQEIGFLGNDLHYWFKARNPAGVPEFCVALRLERRRPDGWERIGSGRSRSTRFCCATDDSKCRPDTATGVWDLFLYPTPRLLRRIRNGNLRVHGFTDLGPSSVILRFKP